MSSPSGVSLQVPSAQALHESGSVLSFGTLTPGTQQVINSVSELQSRVDQLQKENRLIERKSVNNERRLAIATAHVKKLSEASQEKTCAIAEILGGGGAMLAGAGITIFIPLIGWVTGPPIVWGGWLLFDFGCQNYSRIQEELDKELAAILVSDSSDLEDEALSPGERSGFNRSPSPEIGTGQWSVQISDPSSATVEMKSQPPDTEKGT